MKAPLADWRWSADERLFHAVNGYENAALDSVWFAASSHAFGAAVLVLMALWLAVRFRKRVLWPWVSLGLALMLTDVLGARVLKPFFARMRPSFALTGDLVRVLSPASDSGSMPSLHSANAFAIATVMALLVPRAGWLTYPVAALIALSRVGVGVHWPSDIVIGALFGTSMAALAVLPLRKRAPHRYSHAPPG